VRHARGEALDELEPVLAELRTIEGLREKSRGVFYRGSVAWLHFHEDPAGLFADVKVDGTFQRMPVNTQAERKKLVRVARG